MGHDLEDTTTRMISKATWGGSTSEIGGTREGCCDVFDSGDWTAIGFSQPRLYVLLFLFFIPFFSSNESPQDVFSPRAHSLRQDHADFIWLILFLWTHHP
ncbi:hypothetical protein CCHR01_06727 [Colletotrichum chrysophilum]|uniref:Uncharacterized protein n=1 Tax=Colletotrichum chrysophilum TaxID=1836956 RepID=A0AAD9ANI4_9PEZI|nr:hypothetical protein CCHR01_06727 [Colletotrichum chrysophilum]